MAPISGKGATFGMAASAGKNCRRGAKEINPAIPLLIASVPPGRAVAPHSEGPNLRARAALIFAFASRLCGLSPGKDREAAWRGWTQGVQSVPGARCDRT